ncbi:MAG: type A chloramphenicol O-acetyltransferase [Planctomycetes bacterium]|nr:type A chloramphenicol O-acetyltransferase [Planctomycetota bacterium]
MEQPRFTPIDLDTWPRKPYFNHYYKAVRCSYSVTCTLDITELRRCCAEAKVKLYPALIYCLAQAVNQVEEMRVCFDSNPVLGTWNFMTPSYAVFHKDDNTFSNIWTSYNPDFSIFYQAYLLDIKRYGDLKGLFTKPDQPDNCFTVSCLPWVNFTGFNINVFGDGSYLRPIFTIGKYSREKDKTLIPLAVQAHHATCDGHHTSQLVNYVTELTEHCRSWMRIGR